MRLRWGQVLEGMLVLGVFLGIVGTVATGVYLLVALGMASVGW